MELLFSLFTFSPRGWGFRYRFPETEINQRLWDFLGSFGYQRFHMQSIRKGANQHRNYFDSVFLPLVNHVRDFGRFFPFQLVELAWNSNFHQSKVHDMLKKVGEYASPLPESEIDEQYPANPFLTAMNQHAINWNEVDNYLSGHGDEDQKGKTSQPRKHSPILEKVSQNGETITKMVTYCITQILNKILSISKVIWWLKR